MILALFLLFGLLPQKGARAAIDATEARNVLAVFEKEIVPAVSEIFKTQFTIQCQLDMEFPQPLVTAASDRSGTDWRVTIWGASILHPRLTRDGFALLICHELGHHFGGAPWKKESDGSVRWSSAEGQADYYATAVCAKRIFDLLPAPFFDSFSYPQEVKKKCAEQGLDRSGVNLCARTILAAKSFIDASYETELSWMATDAGRVPRTIGVETDPRDGHYEYPSSECRMQTLRNGALCYQISDPRTGDLLGISQRERYCATGPAARPTCWYARD
jgi:hypothetical protein